MSSRNVFSAEVNPQDLIAVAERFGFACDRIVVVEADMGIGAYSTMIEDRPGLYTWLYEDLPGGKSRVVLVSQEDRLFRDRDEIEHNRFIAQMARHGGWAICGQTVYNFRQDFDRERFRMACKYGRQYIEYHIKGRLHPAIHRAALAGRYAGGPVPWGYIVDYDQHSPTFKHFQPYEPHASLVSEQVFRIFAALPHPSPIEVARHWAREGLVWPYFGPDVDQRRIRLVEALCKRDEARQGYQFHFRQAHLILTNVAYLGWRTHAGDIAREVNGQTIMICHPPLVEEELFWWCYDQLIQERPAWAPPRRTLALAASYRPQVMRRRDPEAVPFLAPGRIWCSQHGNPFLPIMYDEGCVILRCHGNDRYRDPLTACSGVSASLVDAALCRAFLQLLVLDERDMQELARIAERRAAQCHDEPAQIEHQVAEHRTRLTRAMQLALKAADEELAIAFLDEARQAKRLLHEAEQQLAARQAAEVPSAAAWNVAERAATFAERIRTTFAEWSRPAQLRVLLLALHEGRLGRVASRSFGLWLRWAGGSESQEEVTTRVAQFAAWTQAERDALTRYYPQLTWPALLAMFPGRTQPALKREAGRLKLSRSARSALSTEVPMVFPAHDVENMMQAYGFPIRAGPSVLEGGVSRQSTRSCSCAR
jgi:DNA invertase Pin-like site-specific DNA recombinase